MYSTCESQKHVFRSACCVILSLSLLTGVESCAQVSAKSAVGLLHLVTGSVQTITVSPQNRGRKFLSSKYQNKSDLHIKYLEEFHHKVTFMVLLHRCGVTSLTLGKIPSLWNPCPMASSPVSYRILSTPLRMHILFTEKCGMWCQCLLCPTGSWLYSGPVMSCHWGFIPRNCDSKITCLDLPPSRWT